MNHTNYHSSAIDAGINPLMDEIGQLLERHGHEDSSGARRMLRDAIRDSKFELIERYLMVDAQAARELRQDLINRYPLDS